MKRLVAWSVNSFDAIGDLNWTILEKTAEFLSKIPRVLAVLMALSFSLFWVLVAGPLTLLAYIVILPFAFWVDTISDGRSILECIWMSISMLACYVVVRFVGCAEVFEGALRITEHRVI